MSPDVVPKDQSSKNQSLCVLAGFHPKPGGVDIAV